MSGTASWLRSHRLELALGLFALGNVFVATVVGEGVLGSIPFHVIWLSLTVAYGFRVWRPRATAAVIAAAVLSSSAVVGVEVAAGRAHPEELFELPILAVTFLAMAWHARRLSSSTLEARRLRERERDFLRDASHTLKSPIARARGYAELVAASASSPSPLVGDVRRLVEELDGMSAIVDDLLLLLVSDEAPMSERRPFDLGLLAHETADRWGVEPARRLVACATEAVTLVGDRDRIARALDALVENAVAATGAGDRIWLVASRDDDRAVLRVVDEGHGILPEDALHVFERFWSRARPGRPRGTGLGLAIVKAIVDWHGGTVEVSSDERGTTFRISLPLAGPALAQARVNLRTDVSDGEPLAHTRSWTPASP